MKKKWSAWKIAWGTLLVLAAVNIQAMENATRKPLAVGEIVSFHSAILSEERTLWVYLPDGYEKSLASYPVLYLLDGERNFLHVSGIVQLLSTLRFIPEMIVVAVLNADRERDFTPASVDGYPRVAGAAQFLLFLKKELIPFAEQNFRASPFRILFGHSLSGLFGAYAFCSQPQLFAAYILTCPSLAWDKKKMLGQMASLLRDQRQAGGFFYLTVAAEDDGPTLKACGELAGLLKKNAPKTLQWHYEVIRDESHGSASHPTVYRALKKIYSGWRIPNSRLAKMSLAQVRSHYQDLSRKFGHVQPALEVSISEWGYIYLERKDFARALEAFSANVASSPQSAYRNDELGYAFESAGELVLAAKYFAAAVALAQAEQSLDLPGYKSDLWRVQEKLEALKQKKE